MRSNWRVRYKNKPQKAYQWKDQVILESIREKVNKTIQDAKRLNDINKLIEDSEWKSSQSTIDGSLKMDAGTTSKWIETEIITKYLFTIDAAASVLCNYNFN